MSLEVVLPAGSGRGHWLPLLCFAAFVVDRVFVVIVRTGNERLFGHVLPIKVLDERLDGALGHLAGELLRRIVEPLFEYRLLAGR